LGKTAMERYRGKVGNIQIRLSALWISPRYLRYTPLCAPSPVRAGTKTGLAIELSRATVASPTITRSAPRDASKGIQLLAPWQAEKPPSDMFERLRLTGRITSFSSITLSPYFRAPVTLGSCP